MWSGRCLGGSGRCLGRVREVSGRAGWGLAGSGWAGWVWLAGWAAVLLAGWLSCWLAGWVTGWLGGMAGWTAGWLGWPAGCCGLPLATAGPGHARRYLPLRPKDDLVAIQPSHPAAASHTPHPHPTFSTRIPHPRPQHLSADVRTGRCVHVRCGTVRWCTCRREPRAVQ